MATVKHKRRHADRQSGMTLIELLIGIIIISIVSAMILVSWFALSRSYSFTATSNKARDNAREATARLTREIRDAESNPDSIDGALVRARPRSVVVYTTFNRVDSASPDTEPHLVMFRLYPDGELWRYYDANGDGVIAGVDMDAADSGLGSNPHTLGEQGTGEGGRLLVKDVVNDKVPSVASPTPLLHYSFYETDGGLVQDTAVTGAANRSKVVSVQFNLLVDLNPAHSPVYTEFQTTAQLRNQQ